MKTVGILARILEVLTQVLVQSYKDKLKNKYSLMDLGIADWLLGINITRDLEA